jgi:hypothetical protein
LVPSISLWPAWGPRALLLRPPSEWRAGLLSVRPSAVCVAPGLASTGPPTDIAVCAGLVCRGKPAPAHQSPAYIPLMAVPLPTLRAHPSTAPHSKQPCRRNTPRGRAPGRLGHEGPACTLPCHVLPHAKACSASQSVLCCQALPCPWRPWQGIPLPPRGGPGLHRSPIRAAVVGESLLAASPGALCVQ